MEEDFYDEEESSNAESDDGEEDDDDDDDKHNHQRNNITTSLQLQPPPHQQFGHFPETTRIAMALITASSQNRIFYHQPSVHLWFTGVSALDTRTSSIFESLGCRVECGAPSDIVQRLSLKQRPQHLSFLPIDPSVDPHFLFLPVINVDVSSAIAIISDLCHQPSQHLVEDAQKVKAVMSQWKEERVDPILPKLFRLLCAAERLIMCQTAFDVFQSI